MLPLLVTVVVIVKLTPMVRWPALPALRCHQGFRHAPVSGQCGFCSGPLQDLECTAGPTSPLLEAVCARNQAVQAAGVAARRRRHTDGSRQSLPTMTAALINSR